MPVIAANPQLSALGLRVVFSPKQGDAGSVLLSDVTETFVLLDQVYTFASEPQLRSPLSRNHRLGVYKISLNSPLELLASIPPAFAAGLITGESLTNFLSFFERVFNLPLAIKVDRNRLLADGEKYRHERLAHERDSREIEQYLAEFERRAKELQLAPEIAEVVELDKVQPRRLDERLDALQRANDIRAARARLKKALKDGETDIEEVLLDPPEYVLTAKVFDFLLVVPKFGRVKANRILHQCRILPSKTIGGLSDRQREELVNRLRK